MVSLTGDEDRVQLLKEEFGEQLRRLRKAANLTQDALARRAGYHRVSITQVEQGRQAFSDQFVTQVEAALDAGGQLLQIYERIEEERHRQRSRINGSFACASALGQLVGSQPSWARGHGSARCLGVVSGALFKLVREALGLTPSGLAEIFALDIATIQGWESGLNPLTALPAGELVRLRVRLMRLGAPPAIFDALNEAVSADLIIAEAVHAGDDFIRLEDHLLASFVQKRSLVNLITWPFTGLAPDEIRCLGSLQSEHYKTGADAFTLDEDERARFFDHLRLMIEASTCGDGALLRRQASYLLGFDIRPESAEWLRTEQHRPGYHVRLGNDLSTWVAVRSTALALARFGNRDPVQAFVQQALTNEQQETANLNYWAYWVGEIPHVEPDDAFMVTTNISSWEGSTLLQHLLNRLKVGFEHADLNVHTLWALLQARPSLLQNHADLRCRARQRVEQLMGDHELLPQTRQKLLALMYAIRLSER